MNPLRKILFTCCFIALFAHLQGKTITLTITPVGDLTGDTLVLKTLELYNMANHTSLLTDTTRVSFELGTTGLTTPGTLAPGMQAWPNPATNKVNITVNAPVAGFATINAYNLNGSLVHTWQGKLQKGGNTLYFKANGSGAVIFTLTAVGYTASQKVLFNGGAFSSLSLQGSGTIMQTGLAGQGGMLKSAAHSYGFSYALGDTLRITATDTCNNTASIYTTLKTDTTLLIRLIEKDTYNFPPVMDHVIEPEEYHAIFFLDGIGKRSDEDPIRYELVTPLAGKNIEYKDTDKNNFLTLLPKDKDIYYTNIDDNSDILPYGYNSKIYLFGFENTIGAKITTPDNDYLIEVEEYKLPEQSVVKEKGHTFLKLQYRDVEYEGETLKGGQVFINLGADDMGEEAAQASVERINDENIVPYYFLK